MKSNFISPVFAEKFPMAYRGNGIYIYDKEGKEYIDGSSGAMTVNLDYNNPGDNLDCGGDQRAA